MPLLLALACAHPGDPPDTTTPTTPTAPSFCATEGFGREVPWDAAGPYGLHRHDLAADFTLALDDGTDWTLSERWTGCESYGFVPDSIPLREGDSASIWTQDLDALLADSPDNVHWFFVSTQDGADADASLAALGEQRDQVIDALGKKQAAWWSERVHVAKQPAGRLNDWLEDELGSPVGAGGFLIDREQRIRGMGSLSDVDRYDPSASWPWDNNLAYAANEVRAINVEADRQTALDAEGATVVPVFGGEVLEQLAEDDVALPDAAAMAGFDTFEIDVDQQCPDPDRGELGNCGAWDYLAGLSLQQDDGTWTELGRFITPYNREAHQVLDASPLLPLLAAGGTRHFKWEFAPYWNTQPTATRLSLRFADRGGPRPATATRVAVGGAFGSTYDDGRMPVDVPIPADAVGAELVVIVTGHGAGTNQCAEFCDHQHDFTVGASTYRVDFPEAGTDAGCRDAGIDQQMTPNQWGTWWFGRGGWCPGQPVAEHRIDVTADVTPGGTASVAYQGLFRDAVPADGSGDIVLDAWLVTYR